MEGKKEVLPQKRYERSMNHNYLILSSYSFFDNMEEENYMTKMLLGNKISGLLPVVRRQAMGEKQYCYEINSLQSLDRLYEKQEIGYEALYKLLSGCIRIFERMEEYLLDGSQILLQPEYIYLHMDTKEPFLVCYPEYDGDVRLSFQKLNDYLLTKIDHTQEQAVWLAYQVYRYTRNPNYVLREIKELLYEAEEMGRAFKNSLYGQEQDIEENIEEEKAEFDIQEHDIRNRNIWGMLLCVLIILSAAGIIFGARLLKLIPLSQKQEVSLYGAIGMSIAAAGIFGVSIIKRWQQEKQIEELVQDTEDEAEEIEILENESEQRRGQHTSELLDATTLLNEEITQERVLKGVISGKEIQIPLNHFPVTLGKLAEYCDYVIPDNTVSRMHARLEQRNGQIFISDLNSTNGTSKNGDMIGIHEEVAMEPGDRIMMGRVSFIYCCM